VKFAAESSHVGPSVELGKNFPRILGTIVLAIESLDIFAAVIEDIKERGLITLFPFVLGLL
jgi:hypothetical protein